MSKKKNKTDKRFAVKNPVKDKNQEIMEELNEISTPYEPDGSENFFPMVLTPTKKGKAALDEISRRKNQKLLDMEKEKQEAEANVPKFDNTPARPAKKVKLDDLDGITSRLDRVVEQIRENGKYGKALDQIHHDTLIQFIDAYAEIDTANEELDQFNSIARKMINIGKSFYEYDSKQREFLSNADYDRLLARYLELGNIEPAGIAPKGKRNMKKGTIKYPTLHNNMDKAYAVYIADPIPDGVKEKDCIEKFLQRVYKALGLTSETELELELSPKIDGVSVNGTVKKDLLVNPQTRGDRDSSVVIGGMNGLQITTMTNDQEFGIQYEAFVTKDDLEKASKYLKLPENYVSCRHAASGLISRLATTDDDNLFEYISLYPIYAEGLEGTYGEVMDYLQNFAVVPKDMPERKIIKGDLKTLLKKISKQFQKLAELRPELSFMIDGMVITVTDLEYQKVIGREGRTNKYQIALKFDPSTAVGIVKGIWLDTGRKGYRTIQVDLVEPIYLDGVEYDHVPVLSADLFNELELRKGSKVSIHRVGDVIPAIKVIEAGDGEKIKLPQKCPGCGQDMMIKSKKLYCPNPLCKDNIVGRLVEFFDKLGMDDYGDSFAELLHTKLGVDTISDLFLLVNEDTIKESKINSKKLEEFPEALREAVGKTTDYKIIGAMGIPGVGPAKAKLLLKTYGLDGLVKMDRLDIKYEPVVDFCLKLVGATTYEATANFLESNIFHDDIREVVRYIKKITTNFEDLYQVGHSGYTPSDDVQNAVENQGWEITDGRKFNILIVPDHGYTSGKVELAKKKSIPIVTEEEFIEMVERR